MKYQAGGEPKFAACFLFGREAGFVLAQQS